MNRLQYDHLCVRTGVWVCLLVLFLQHPVQSQTPAKEDIWTAWREREAGIESVEAKWTQNLILSARAVAEYSSPTAPSGREESSADMVTPEYPCILTIAGNKLRFESEIPHFGGALGGELNPSVRAFDGQLQQSFVAMRERTSRSNVGGIDEAEEATEWNSLECAPLIFAVRPSRIEGFAAPGDCWIENANVLVDGRPCVELRHRFKGAGPQQRIVNAALVDQMPPYPVRRIRHSVSGSTSAQLDMHYDDQADPPWMPIAWEHSIFYRDGELRRGAEAQLVSLSLNVEVPEDTFRIEYPPGTIVSDGRRDNKRFIVDSDGRFLPFTSGQGIPSDGRTTGFYVVIIGILAMAGAAFWWKRSSRA